MNPRRSVTREERGFTLIELSVTMAVMTVVSVILLTVLGQTSSVVVHSSGEVQAENNAQLTMRTMTEDIRAARNLSFTSSISGACPGASAAGNCLSFTVLRDSYSPSYPNCQSLITYGLVSDTDPSSLTGWKVARTGTTINCPANSPTATSTLLTNLGGTALFNYYDGGGNVLTSGQGQAKSIGITLTVSYATRTSPLTLTSYVALRNAR